MTSPLRTLVIVFTFTLLCWPVAAWGADTWVEVRSPHFTVVGNAGEKETRRIANQFEEIRAVFHFIFPTLHVDPGAPIEVIAVKNENSMKEFLPDFWVGKDRAHPAGMYVSGFDETFAILRTDVTGSAENPYHSLYHEYTHTVLRLNYSALPVWLNEGLAEFYGNTVIEDNETDIGRVSSAQLALLQRSSMIPIDQLMGADQRSPLYNERDRTSIFYSESWAIVHYLMLDPEATQQHYLTKYLNAWDETRDGEEAARRTFGDLKKFQSRIESYARQAGFHYLHGKPQAHFSANDYTARTMTPAEALVVQVDFFQHTGHMNDARKLLSQALGLQPNLAAIHAGLGYDNYVQYSNDEAEKEFKKATELNPQDFRSFFYLAEITHRKGYDAQSTSQIVKYLEKTVQINPNFAPAYAFLSAAYRQQKETREKAVDAAVKANHLEPTILAYMADVGDALMALDRDAEARAVGEKINKNALSPQEKALAQSYARRLARHEELARNKQNPGTGEQSSSGDEELASQDEADMRQSSGAVTASAEAAARPPVTSEEGLIREADCSASPGATIKFAILGETLVLSVPDLAKIEYHAGEKDLAADAIPCSQWKGRKAKITFKAGDGKASQGDVTAINFH